MAVIKTTPVHSASDEKNYRTFTANGELVVGVVLSTRIPSGNYPSGLTAGDEYGDIKIRPTNVTATISSEADEDPNFIVLHNGPAGGFTQQLQLAASGTYRANAAVLEVITTPANS